MPGYAAQPRNAVDMALVGQNLLQIIRDFGEIGVFLGIGQIGFQRDELIIVHGVEVDLVQGRE
ncbi:hypothetical protein D3C76_1795820 [compost metagenome]